MREALIAELVMIRQQRHGTGSPSERSSIDRIAYYVRDTARARSSNMFDLLERIPSIEVTASEQLRLLGRSGVRILIDGNAVANVQAVLRNLQGSQVERAAARPRLSRRERQCVALVAAGKTDWEIVAILRISVETAHQYVKSARASCDVVSRAQLVVCAVRDAVIDFDPCIRPPA